MSTMFSLKYCMVLVSKPVGKKIFRAPLRYFNQNVVLKKYNCPLNSCIIRFKQPSATNFLHSHLFKNQKQVLRHFHTSQPRYALPGFVYLIFKPILRVFAIVIARISRKWWAKLTPDQKKKIYSYILKNQTKIGAASLTSIGLAYIFYFLHLETCPITGRQKFIIVKPSQLLDIAQVAYDAFYDDYADKVLPSKHPAYYRSAIVVKRLLDANKVYTEYFNYKYPITIINDPTVNAFVLPDGRIFIFTGMLQVCQTDDELATVLAHELSHTLLKHVAEKLSNKTFLEILYIVPLMIIWFLLPDLGAVLTQVLLDDLKSIVFELPFERDQETEADEVGLKLMARACYDVRVAPLFWQKMAVKETQEQVGPKMDEYLSTHPSHENRAYNLESKMKEALKIRQECNCSPLGPLFVPQPSLLRQIFTLRPAAPA